MAAVVLPIDDPVGAVLFGSRSELPRVVQLIYLPFLLPMWAVGARRLHDIGKSGWWQLIPLLPYLIPLLLVIVILDQVVFKTLIVLGFILGCIGKIVLWFWYAQETNSKGDRFNLSEMTDENVGSNQDNSHQITNQGSPIGKLAIFWPPIIYMLGVFFLTFMGFIGFIGIGQLTYVALCHALPGLSFLALLQFVFGICTVMARNDPGRSHIFSVYFGFDPQLVADLTRNDSGWTYILSALMFGLSVLMFRFLDSGIVFWIPGW